jgi:hypothetical protein
MATKNATRQYNLKAKSPAGRVVGELSNNEIDCLGWACGRGGAAASAR